MTLLVLISGRNRHTGQTRRSPESMASYGIPHSVHESSNSPLPIISTSNTRRVSVMAPSGAGFGSPEYAKPSTPYEDKVIPTLRNRNRIDTTGGAHPQPSVMSSIDAGGIVNDETESVQGGSNNNTSNDDAIAELNQAEMIEANQMMIVFDKQLVRTTKKRSQISNAPVSRLENCIIVIMHAARKLSMKFIRYSAISRVTLMMHERIFVPEVLLSLECFASMC